MCWEGFEIRSNRIGELQIHNTVVNVVDSSDDRITIRVNGENRLYDKRDLPSGLAMAIAKSWLDENNIANKLFEDAFLAVDPNGSLRGTRQAWEVATSGDRELQDILRLLDDEVFFIKPRIRNSPMGR